MGLLPIAIGTSVLAAPLVRFLFPVEYADASTLLAIGIWRAPLLTLAFLYQAALIALNREAIGVWRADERVAVAAELGAQIVAEDPENIGAGLRGEGHGEGGATGDGFHALHGYNTW